ncbi:MAG TPA: catalase family peroxidase [Pirellulaceae bacterium]|jgi:catalase
MPPALQNSSAPSDTLVRDLLASFDAVFGLHAGFRPVHAKGVMCSGTFTPTPAAAKLTRAAHVARPSSRVIVRLSDFAGVPVVPDNDSEGAGPRGMAIRFYLAEHSHTDIVAHSADGFPVRTGEEFLELNRAVAASPPTAPHPWPIEAFLGAHPLALRFVQMPKPIPTSFARESFFAVSAFQFTSTAGTSRFGRYRIRPAAGNEYLSVEDAAKKSPNFLIDDITNHLKTGPISYRIFVQLAGPGDEVNDATAVWPDDREEIEFGTVTLTERVNELAPDMRKIIFDPRPGVDGIAPSADPLFDIRAALYLVSGRRRRAATI